MTIDQALVVYPQITLDDLRAAVGHLDVDAFVRVVGPLAWSSAVPETRDEALVRCLHEVPLAREGAFAEVLDPYISSPIDRRWLHVIKSLRVRGRASSAWLAHGEALAGADYVVRAPGCLVAESRDAPRRLVLRPVARTLAVRVPRTPGGPELGRAPKYQPAEDADLEALAETVEGRVRSTLGGKMYLAPAPHARALAVLAATVRAVLEQGAAQRWHGRQRVVRADVYRSVFEHLGLGQYFEAARRYLEADHPDRYVIDAPWPPGVPGPNRDLSILEERAGYLMLRREARLTYVGR